MTCVNKPSILVPIASPRGDAVAILDPDDIALATKAWNLTANGYAQRKEGPAKARTAVLMHREVLGLRRGDGLEVDHINGDKLDNRRSNLRIATRQINSQNQRLMNRRSKSGLRGVYWHKQAQKWAATVQHGKRRYRLGLFANKYEAARAAARQRKALGFAEGASR